MRLQVKRMVLLFQTPFELLDGYFAYCNPTNDNHPNTPYIMIVDGVEHGLHDGVYFRGQTSPGILLNENSKPIDLVCTGHGF